MRHNIHNKAEFGDSMPLDFIFIGGKLYEKEKTILFNLMQGNNFESGCK